jgi:hypothetical protein
MKPTIPGGPLMPPQAPTRHALVWVNIARHGSPPPQRRTCVYGQPSSTSKAPPLQPLDNNCAMIVWSACQGSKADAQPLYQCEPSTQRRASPCPLDVRW